MKCPICKRDFDPPAAAGETKSQLPFCSERCKVVDLGRWLSGAYQVPVVEADESDIIHPIDPHEGDRPKGRKS